MKITNKIIASLATLTFLNCSAVASEVLTFGAKTDALNSVTSAAAGLKEGQGFVVTKVREGSAAAKLGLLKGDVVTALNGKTVNNLVMLSKLIAATASADEELSLTWVRDGETHTKSVVVNEKVSREAFAKEYNKFELESLGVMPTVQQKYVMKMGPNGMVTSRIMGDYTFSSSKDKKSDTEITKVEKTETGELVYEGEVDVDDLSAAPTEIHELLKQYKASPTIGFGAIGGAGGAIDINKVLKLAGVTNGGIKLSDSETQKTEKSLEDLVEDDKENKEEKK